MTAKHQLHAGERQHSQIFKTAPLGAYVLLDDLIQLRLAARGINPKLSMHVKTQGAGNRISQFRGRGMIFEESRQYQPGDDIRNMDWRVTARTLVPHTKVFREERERPVLLLVDQRSNMFFGSQYCFKSVWACHCAALLGWVTIANNDRIGGVIIGDTSLHEVKPARSSNRLLKFVGDLARYNQQLKRPSATHQRQSLTLALDHVQRLARPGTLIIIISDFSDALETLEPSLKRLRQHNELGLIHVSDPLENTLNAYGMLALTDGKNRWHIDSANPRIQKQYTQAAEAHQHAIEDLALKLRSPLLQANCQAAVRAQLQTLFNHPRGSRA